MLTLVPFPSLPFLRLSALSLSISLYISLSPSLSLSLSPSSSLSGACAHHPTQHYAAGIERAGAGSKRGMQRRASGGGGGGGGGGGDASADSQLKNVTFACKNGSEHSIWTVTLQILIKLLDGSNVETLGQGQRAGREKREGMREGGREGGREAGNLSGLHRLALPSHVMTSEINRLARAMANMDASAVLRTAQSKMQVRSVGIHYPHPSPSPSPFPSSFPHKPGKEGKEGKEWGEEWGEEGKEAIYGHAIADSWVWGAGMNKVGPYVADQKYPTLMHGQKTLDAFLIASGANHVAVVDQLGSIYCWGRNAHGQLGHGAPVEFVDPTRVKALEGKVSTRTHARAHTHAHTHTRMHTHTHSHTHAHTHTLTHTRTLTHMHTRTHTRMRAHTECPCIYTLSCPVRGSGVLRGAHDLRCDGCGGCLHVGPVDPPIVGPPHMASHTVGRRRTSQGASFPLLPPPLPPLPPLPPPEAASLPEAENRFI